ncbi:MAG: peptide deformylase [Terriglobia bacterium]
MIYPIVKYGAAVLEREAARVSEFDASLAQLVEDMFASMYAANGIGLAAPQIGISQQLAVINITSGQDPAAGLVLVNPEILFTEGRQNEEEGCLSLPGFHAEVRRPQRVTIRAQDATGRSYTRTGEGLLARALCHEIDHLHGRLFIQHLSLLKRDLIRRKIRKRVRAGEW